MGITMTVAGYTMTGLTPSKKLLTKSLGYQKTLGQIDMVDATIVSEDGAFIPQVGHPVALADSILGGFFGGYIETSKSMILEGSEGVSTRITALGWEAKCKQRYTGYRFYNGLTAGAIIRDLITNCMTGDGFNADNVADGPTIEFIEFDYLTVAQAIDAIRDMCPGYYWFVDHDKSFHFKLWSADAAPFNFIDGDGNALIGIAHQVSSGDGYANRVYLRMDHLIQESVTDTLHGDNSTRIFTTTKPISAIKSISAKGVSKTDIGINGIDSGKQYYWDPGSTRVVQGDTEDLLGPDDDLVIEYTAEIEAVLPAVQDNDEIDARSAVEGGTGYHELIIRSNTTGKSGDGSSIQQAYLDTYGKLPESVELLTLKAGLRVGHNITVQRAKLGVNGSFMIDQISMEDSGGIFRWSVRCVSGASLGDWKSKLNSLVTGSSGGSVSAGGSTGTTPTTPGNVVLGTPLVRMSPPDENGKVYALITIPFTPPDPVGSWNHVWGYLSAPSDEATNSKAVVGADGDEGFFVGTSDVASNLVPTSNPVPFGPFNANDQVITIKYPAPDSVQTWKVKAPSGSTDQENDIESGPTVEFTVDPSAATGPSGEEYAPNAKDFQVVVTYQDADGGNKTWGFDDSWTNPTEDPRYSLLGGYDVVIEYQDGRKETQDSPARNRTTGSATGWVIPVTTESFKVWLVSWDVNGRRNSIVDGVTPKVVITVGPQMGSAGQEYAALVSGLTAEVTYSKTVDGVEKYTILTKWTNPTDDPAFAGGKIVLRPTSGNDQVLGYVGPLDTEFLWGPYDIGSPITYTPYFVSMDNNGRENTLVPGTTPSAADIIIEAQTTGGLNGGRIDPLTLNPTLGIVGGKLGVPDGALSIASFASTIRPPVLVSAKPTFPDAQYPAGTIFYHTTEHKLYRVKSTGNDWQLAVTGADIVSNSITSGQIAAGAIGTNELFAGEILVGAGGSKPGRFKVVAAGGATAAWVGDDGAGHVGVYAKALWVGPDIDHPQFYCDASGNATFAGALSASVVVLGSQVSGAVGSATTAANAGSATTATTALSAGSMSLASGTKTLYLNTTDWIKMTDSASAWETSFANAYLNIRKTSDATALVELNPYSLKVQYTTNVGFFLGALPYNTGITSVATINNGVNSITLSLPGFMQSGSSRIVMNGTQVLTVQQSAIADLSGAATLADAIAKINAILSMQRVHGLISY